MLNNLFDKKLKLAKTYDNCPSGKPKMAVVMIHGIASSSKTWDSAISYLSGTRSLNDIRFITFDLLGSGESSKSEKLNFDFKDQLEALDNSIEDLKLDIPMVLVGHSMGCLIAARYTDLHRRKVKEVILVSPPIYTPTDFKNPAFEIAQEGFRQVVFQKNPELREDKAFNNEMKKIVMNQKNYEILARIPRKTTIIYGLADRIIASYNIPGLLRKNSLISAIETPGTHGVLKDKYTKMVPILERILHETI